MMRLISIKLRKNLRDSTARYQISAAVTKDKSVDEVIAEAVPEENQDGDKKLALGRHSYRSRTRNKTQLFPQE